MTRSSLFLRGFVFSQLAFFFWLAGCATSLGPGYIVQKQEIRATFAPQPQPSIAIVAEYHLTNTGNQPLHSLEVRLPGRRFRPGNMQVTWDAAALAASPSTENPRDTTVRFPEVWKINESHSLEFSYEIPSQPPRDDSLGFSADAFYLPSEGWIPHLPQASGFLGFGGVPPKKWQLIVQVPQGFLVHASGQEKRSGKHSAVEYHFIQTSKDLNAFVVAGRYRETQLDLASNQKVRIWTRSEIGSARLRQSAEALSRTIATYDALFGTRGASHPPLWFIECPSLVGCMFQAGTAYSVVLYGHETARTAELISRDSVLIDARESASSLEAAAAPALAEGWLGYGQSPGFYEQQAPMTALPAFATALALEASSGAGIRAEIVRRALSEIPEHATVETNASADVTRAKSLLLLYALRDRVGPEAFRKALHHMLYARRSRGFDVTDLISALEQESHQSVGPFVRQWIRGPGVPEEFRRRFSASAVLQESSTQETTR